jgi:signal transduction histidine kinase
MTVDQLITYLSWGIYVLIFVSVAIRAVRRPLRANIDILLLFGLPTLVIILTILLGLGLLPPAPPLMVLLGSLLLGMGYLSVRLVDDFAQVPRWLLRAAAVALALLVILGFLLAPAPPVWFALIEILYLEVLLLYSVAAFVRESRRASGVTRRRMVAVAIGSLCLCIDFALTGLRPLLPGSAAWVQPLTELAGLASAISYFLGFAPPSLLRRAWQEPELRAFLGRAARLPRLPDTASIVREMELGAATSIGAPQARIGLWDADAEALRFTMEDGPLVARLESIPVTARIFIEQRPLFTDNLQRDNPATANSTRSRGATAMLGAPITAGEKRLGVLVAYAARAPIFADEDLALVQLLADQAAVILESRALIDEAARVRAREEVTRLKEDFLSAAAHDLKTPLTTIVGLSQLLERRALRQPEAPADLVNIQKLVREAQRLKTLVLELLDAARTEQGQLVGTRVELDLVALAEEICERHTSPRHPCQVEASGPAIGDYDPNRVQQLLENLVENAVKYSPAGGTVRIKVWRNDDWNHLSVTDQGIGIPAADLPHVFERFHRGTNVDDRQFAGMGLGLYICHGIAEQHGGRIVVHSSPQGGSTFEVALPAAPVALERGIRNGR